MEFASQKNASLMTIDGLKFAISTLTSKPPGVKLESAKVIGNIAHLYPNDLENVIEDLLITSKHNGIIVR